VTGQLAGRQFFPGPGARRLRLERVPPGRSGTPEDAAALACFLASGPASWGTGQVVVFDGGISCNYL
jgi:3-oxoacyl-[acyl-carrier protein] reductase